jgi:hypothetical protein
MIGLSLADGCQPNNPVFKSTDDDTGAAVAFGFSYRSTEKSMSYGKSCTPSVPN